MKTSAKVDTINGVASCLISLIILIFYVFNIDAFVNIINQEVSLTQPEQDNLKLIYSVIFTIAIIEFIGSIVVGILHLVFLFQNKTKKQCLPTAILTLIFVNLIAGILSLCMKDEQYIL